MVHLIVRRLVRITLSKPTQRNLSAHVERKCCPETQDMIYIVHLDIFLILLSNMLFVIDYAMCF